MKYYNICINIDTARVLGASLWDCPCVCYNN